MSAGNLCDWEKGRTEPDIEKLIMLANYFDVSLDVLVGREIIFQKDTEFTMDKNKYKLLEIYKKLTPALQKKLVDFLDEFIKSI